MYEKHLLEIPLLLLSSFISLNGSPELIFDEGFVQGVILSLLFLTRKISDNLRNLEETFCSILHRIGLWYNYFMCMPSMVPEM